MPKLNIDVSDEMHESIRQAAKQEGITIKAWVLEALQPIFDEYDKLVKEQKIS